MRTNRVTGDLQVLYMTPPLSSLCACLFRSDYFELLADYLTTQALMLSTTFET